MKPIMDLDEVQFDDIEDNGYYTSQRGRISDHIGASKLGHNLTVLPAGKAQCGPGLHKMFRAENTVSYYDRDRHVPTPEPEGGPASA